MFDWCKRTRARRTDDLDALHAKVVAQRRRNVVAAIAVLVIGLTVGVLIAVALRRLPVEAAPQTSHAATRVLSTRISV